MKLNLADIILLGLNTTWSAVITFILFEQAGIHDYRGILAIIFALIYIGLGFFMDKKMKEERNTILLFFITAMTFVILIIPFQFGISWMSIGWLIESTLLIIIGYKKQRNKLENSGAIIFLFCLIAFYFFDVFPKYRGMYVEFFELKYWLITLGLCAILTIYQIDIVKNKISGLSIKGNIIKWLKYFTIIHTLIFVFYISNTYYTSWIVNQSIMPSFFLNFYRLLMIAILIMGSGFILAKLKLFKDKVTKAISIILYIIGDIIGFYLLFFLPIVGQAKYIRYINNPYLTVFSIIFLILYNILVIGNIRHLVIRFLRYKDKSIEFYPLIIGLVLLAKITGLIIVQFNLGDINLVLSFAYLFLALGSIIYGFIRHYAYIRFFGLALTVIALAKLFILDLSYLDIGGKIIAYLGFGIILIIISFIYQSIKTKLDKPKEAGQNK